MDLFEHRSQPTVAATNNIIIIEGLSLLQSIPPTTANKHSQTQKRGVANRGRKLLGANAKIYRLKTKTKTNYKVVSISTDKASTGW